MTSVDPLTPNCAVSVLSSLRSVVLSVYSWSPLIRDSALLTQLHTGLSYSCNILALDSQSVCERQSLVYWISSTIHGWYRPLWVFTKLGSEAMSSASGTTLYKTQGNSPPSFLPSTHLRSCDIFCPFDSFSSQQNQHGHLTITGLWQLCVDRPQPLWVETYTRARLMTYK